MIAQRSTPMVSRREAVISEGVRLRTEGAMLPMDRRQPHQMSVTRGTEQIEGLTAGYGPIFVNKCLQHFIHHIQVKASSPRLFV
jgi:hypothetical protein